MRCSLRRVVSAPFRGPSGVLRGSYPWRPNSWTSVRYLGLPARQSFMVRLQRNSDFLPLNFNLLRYQHHRLLPRSERPLAPCQTPRKQSSDLHPERAAVPELLSPFRPRVQSLPLHPRMCTTTSLSDAVHSHPFRDRQASMASLTRQTCTLRPTCSYLSPISSVT